MNRLTYLNLPDTIEALRFLIRSQKLEDRYEFAIYELFKVLNEELSEAQKGNEPE